MRVNDGRFRSMFRSVPQQVSVIAHRGASSSAPENTVAAVIDAVDAGADMIELDVQMTRDRRLVVFHDEGLGRTTNLHGVLASNHYSYLRDLDAGGWFHSKFNGERIPLLTDIFEAVPAALSINLELKPTRHPSEFVQSLIRDLASANRLPSSSSTLDQRTLVSSEDALLLKPCVAEGLSIALVTEGDPLEGLKMADDLGCCAWHPDHDTLTPEVVDAARTRGLKVHTWTVDVLERMRELTNWGVDGIITNVPETLRSMLSHREERIELSGLPNPPGRLATSAGRPSLRPPRRD